MALITSLKCSQSHDLNVISMATVTVSIRRFLWIIVAEFEDDKVGNVSAGARAVDIIIAVVASVVGVSSVSIGVAFVGLGDGNSSVDKSNKYCNTL